MIENIRLAFQGIWGHKMRSVLTMLGIIIGIAAVMVIVSVINGANQKQMEYYESMGTNKIAASLGGLTATAQYIRSGKINFSIAIPAAVFAYLGGQVGAGTAMHLSEDFLNVMMLFGGILIPIVYTSIAYGEKPTALQWGAIAVMLAACFLMNRDDIKLSGTSPVYYLLCLALFVSNGAYGTLLKIQSNTAGDESREMVMLTYFLMGVIAFAMLLRTEKKDTLKAFRFDKRSLPPLLICLLSAAAAINLLVFILPLVNTAVLYTTDNGGVLVLSCVYSVLIFTSFS